MIEPGGVGSALPRAFLRVGGFSLARHQMGVALSLGCERIVCIAREWGPELLELQHAAEEHGARFHVISGSRGLIGLISANDDLIVLADGLLAEPDEMVSHLDVGHGVIVQPIELGEPAGFERIDLNHASGGAMRMPGGLVERLAELPADCDVVSSLQRIALQASLPQRMLVQREGRAWRLVRDEGEAQIVESDWFRQHTGRTSASSASDIAALAAVRSVGPALMHSGNGGNTVGIFALAAVLLAMGVAWFRFLALAFFLCALAEVLRRAASLLIRIERRSLNLQRSILPRELLFGWLIDIALIAVLTLGRSIGPDEGVFEHAFPAVTLILMLRLVPQLLRRPWAHWLEDRGLLAVLLGLAVVTAGTMPTGLAAAAAVVLGIVGVLWPNRPVHLTRV